MEQNMKITSSPWKIALFALNNVSTNIYMAVMGYIAYYASGFIGIATVTVGVILTSMRLFDGITDPIIGYVIDKTNGRFGRYRPFMLIGNIGLFATTVIIYNVPHMLPKQLQFVAFILIYILHIIFYTFQTACTKAAQTVLTKNPKQRPLFSFFDGIYNQTFFVASNVIIMSVLISAMGYSFSELRTFNTIIMLFCPISFIFTCLSVFALKDNDKSVYYEQTTKIKVKMTDYITILKGNRPLQMLVIAASTDKLAGTVARNNIVMIMLFGIVIGDIGLSGATSVITVIPVILFTFFGVRLAAKRGIKKAFLLGTWGSLISYSLIAIISPFGDRTGTYAGSPEYLIFLVLLIVTSCFLSLSSSMTIPMIADCADYETYRSGRMAAGMVSTLFSFVDKLISSLGQTLVTLLISFIGYTNTIPLETDPYTDKILMMTLILYCGLPIFGNICSVISMKFYKLNLDKMKEVQLGIELCKVESEFESEYKNYKSDDIKQVEKVNAKGYM